MYLPLEIRDERHAFSVAADKAAKVRQEIPGPLIGQRLGPYEIRSLLGAGGMGEVYLARDTTLGRDVAIKILPSAFMADPERRARFEREARLLAALNHPHIGGIYGFEQREDVCGLILELVEGETSSATLGAGPLPVREARCSDCSPAATSEGPATTPANIRAFSDLLPGRETS